MTGPPVHCRYATAAELGPLVRRPLSAWLGKRELAELRHWRDTARRAQWLAGRALAKQLALDCMPESSVDGRIEITSRSASGRGTRPQLWFSGRREPCSLSLAHTGTCTVAALCVAPGFSVGIDLAPSEAAARPALRRWFTPAERAWLDRGGDAALVWAAKEAVFKAANCGEPFSPRDVGIERRADGSLRCAYRGVPLAKCCTLNHWRVEDQTAVLAVVSAGAPDEDCRVLPGVQEGLAAGDQPRGGLISTREERVVHFQRYIERSMNGTPTRSAGAPVPTTCDRS